MIELERRAPGQQGDGGAGQGSPETELRFHLLRSPPPPSPELHRHRLQEYDDRIAAEIDQLSERLEERVARRE